MAGTTHKSMEVYDGTPSGAGGQALDNNFVAIANRIGSYIENASDPDANDDDQNTGSNGTAYQNSLWLNTTSNALWLCTDATVTAAVWSRVFDGAPQAYGNAPQIYGGGWFTPAEFNPVIDTAHRAFGTVVRDPSTGTWHFFGGTGSGNGIFHQTSSDGFTWGNETTISNLGHNGVPSVWIEAGTWYMLYRSAGDDGIDLATSSDGTTWVENGGNPVLSGTAEEWDSSGRLDPWGIIKVGSTYYLYYCTVSTGTSRSVGIATAPDGDLTDWTKDENNPILEDGHFCPWVIKLGDWYYMFSVEYAPVTSNWSRFQCYVDKSPTFYAAERTALGPVFHTDQSVAWMSEDIDTPCIPTDDIYRNSFRCTGGTLRLYYSATSDGVNNWKEGVAFYSNFSNESAYWTKKHNANGQMLYGVDQIVIGVGEMGESGNVGSGDAYAPLHIGATVHNAHGLLELKDIDNAGTDAKPAIAFADSTQNDSSLTGVLGKINFSATDLKIQNFVEDGDMYLLINDGGVTRSIKWIAATNVWNYVATSLYTSGYLQASELRLLEKSADPDEPLEGRAVIWMSNGTSDQTNVADGDIAVASKVGGATKVTIIHDHSAGEDWI